MGRQSMLLGGRVRLILGNIVNLRADAIVNAANRSLYGGGGVDGAIHKAGGPAILRECQEIRRTSYPKGLPTGEAVVTGAGVLQAKYVIHTVGPIWHGGKDREAEMLSSSYRKSLLLAEQIGARSILFPSISTGAFGYPREKAARVVWECISEYVKNHALPAEIGLVFFAPVDCAIFEKQVEGARQV